MFKFKGLLVVLIAVVSIMSLAHAAGGPADVEYAYPDKKQAAKFPVPNSYYESSEGKSMGEILVSRIQKDPFNLVATIIFFLAIFHTFAAAKFNKMAHHFELEHRAKIAKEGRRGEDKPQDDAQDDVSFKASLFHFLGEIEAIFGIWVIALAGAASYFYSWTDFKHYVSIDKYFAEPIFVVIIMAIAASRPVLKFSEQLMAQVAKLGQSTPLAWWLSVLTVAPILGSFITEPAAMTIAALLLSKKFYSFDISNKLKYATLGLLFVNISVGGTLTHFAAPPVLMVAGTWDWNMLDLLLNFGWKSVIGIIVSNLIYVLIFAKELKGLATQNLSGDDNCVGLWEDRDEPVPAWVTFVHLFFLGWTVMNVHDPVLFVLGFLFFLAFVTATNHHQNRISLKTPLLVGFFLAGLVIHGGCQGWWIDPIIRSLGDGALMIGATVLTAFNDNAAITYLAAQVEGISDGAKYAVVAGAVAGGGLTVIANAPNPAGQSILSKHFKDGVSPLGLLLGALIPTVVVFLFLMFLPSFSPHHKVGPSYGKDKKEKKHVQLEQFSESDSSELAVVAVKH